jgi:arylsulfatase A-like enzyme
MLNLSDADIRNFLEWMNQNGHLDNTLLIVMSDHGSRFSSIQQTAQGKLL